MPARRAAAVAPLLLVTLFAILLIVPGAPAQETSIRGLELARTAVRFSRTLEVESECVVPAGETICAGEFEPVFTESLSVRCPIGGCVLELQTCVEYRANSSSDGHFGGSLQFTVDGAEHPHLASHYLVLVDGSTLDWADSSACFLAIVPDLAGGVHTVNVVVGADIVLGGVVGDVTTLNVKAASLVVRVHRD